MMGRLSGRSEAIIRSEKGNLPRRFWVSLKTSSLASGAGAGSTKTARMVRRGESERRLRSDNRSKADWFRGQHKRLASKRRMRRNAFQHCRRGERRFFGRILKSRGSELNKGSAATARSGLVDADSNSEVQPGTAAHLREEDSKARCTPIAAVGGRGCCEEVPQNLKDVAV